MSLMLKFSEILSGTSSVVIIISAISAGRRKRAYFLLHFFLESSLFLCKSCVLFKYSFFIDFFLDSDARLSKYCLDHSIVVLGIFGGMFAQNPNFRDKLFNFILSLV